MLTMIFISYLQERMQMKLQTGVFENFSPRNFMILICKQFFCFRKIFIFAATNL